MVAWIAQLQHLLVWPESLSLETFMRAYVPTLTGACLILSLNVPANGQTFSKASSGHPQETGRDKDPKAIVELGAATS